VVNWFCQDRLKLQGGRVMFNGEVLGEQGYAAD
jgi:phosphoribosylglycinamide formyltransferase-1